MYTIDITLYFEILGAVLMVNGQTKFKHSVIHLELALLYSVVQDDAYRHVCYLLSLTLVLLNSKCRNVRKKSEN